MKYLLHLVTRRPPSCSILLMSVVMCRNTKAHPSMVSRKTRSMVHMSPDCMWHWWKDPPRWVTDLFSQPSLKKFLFLRWIPALSGDRRGDQSCVRFIRPNMDKFTLRRRLGAFPVLWRELDETVKRSSRLFGDQPSTCLICDVWNEEATTDWTASITSRNDSTFPSCSFFHPRLKKCYIEPPRLKTPTCYFLFKVLTFSFLLLSYFHLYRFVWQTCKYRSI